MIKKIIYSLVFLGFLGASFGLYMFNKPLESINSMSTDFSLTSDSLLGYFETNEELANKKYLDKVIEVSGEVDKIKKEGEKMAVYLATENPMSNIITQFEKDDPSIKTGQSITVKGICTGYLMDVVLVRGKKIIHK